MQGMRLLSPVSNKLNTGLRTQALFNGKHLVMVYQHQSLIYLGLFCGCRSPSIRMLCTAVTIS